MLDASLLLDNILVSVSVQVKSQKWPCVMLCFLEIAYVQNKILHHVHPGLALSAKPTPSNTGLTHSDRPPPVCHGLILFSDCNSDEGRGEFSKGLKAGPNVGGHLEVLC